MTSTTTPSIKPFNNFKPRPIIFLDIDGVLNKTKNASQLHFEPHLLSRLHSILVRTDGIIVLTTFWRQFRDYIAYVFHRHGIDVQRHMVMVMEKEDCGGGGGGGAGVTGGKQRVVEFLDGFRRCEGRVEQEGQQEGLQRQEEQVGDDESCCQHQQVVERQCNEPTNEKNNDGNKKDGAIGSRRSAKDEAEYSSRAEEIEAWLKKYGERYLGSRGNGSSNGGANGGSRDDRSSDGSQHDTRTPFAERDDSERGEYEFHSNRWKYVILDDRPSAAKPDTPLFDRFVHTDTKSGLTEEDSERAIRLLLFGPQAS